MMRPLNRPDMRHPRTAPPSAVLLLVATALALALGWSACGDSAADNATDAAAAAAAGEGTPNATDPLPRSLGGESCTDPVRASVRPSPEVRDAHGVMRYEWAQSGGRTELEIQGAAEETLATLVSEASLVLDPDSGRLSEWRVESTLQRGGEVAASQLLRGRALPRARIWLELVHRAGDQVVHQWLVLDDALEAESLTIGVVVDEDTEGAQRLAEGPWVETLAVIEGSGERLDADTVDEWLHPRTEDVFAEDPDWLLLHAAGTDLRVREAADAHVRLCRAASVDAAEEALIKARCAEAKRRGEAKCSRVDGIVDGLEWLLTVNDVMGAVGTGSAVTAGLVAAGVVATGPAIGATFIAATAGSIIASELINNAVQDNSDAIFDGLGRAGGAATGGDGDAFSDFFGGSVGDPHFDTLDGVSYDFMGGGEYLLLEATEGAPFTIQTRQEPADGICPNVAVNSAVVVFTGTHRIAYYADREWPLYLDGAPVAFAGGVAALPDGGVAEEVNRDAGRVELRWPNGDAVMVSRRSSSRSAQLDVWVALDERRSGAVQGLLGDFDGDPSNDIRTREGVVLDPPYRWQELTWEFGESWRITEEESLFDYFDGESWEGFLLETFPEEPTRIEDLPEGDRQFAEETCADRGIDEVEEPAAWRGCVIDVGCTGEPVFADAHAERAGGEPVEMLPPIEDELATDVLPPASNRILWTFSDETTEPDSFPESVTASAIESSEGISRFEVTDSYNYPNSPVFRFSPSTGTDSAEEAVEAGTWVEFEIAPTGDPVVLDRFLISMARGAAIGPERGLLLRYEADGFSRNLWYDTVLTQRPEIRRFNVPLPNVVVDQPTRFRLYLHTPGSARTIEIGDMAFDLRE